LAKLILTEYPPLSRERKTNEEDKMEIGKEICEHVWECNDDSPAEAGSSGYPVRCTLCSQGAWQRAGWGNHSGLPWGFYAIGEPVLEKGKKEN